MDAVDETVIELSKPKIVLMTAGSVAFVAIGIWLVSHDQFFDNAIGIICIVFFAATGLATAKKFVDNRPGLVLNSEGIIDNASGISAGFVPWSDIKGTRIYETSGQKMLTVLVKNPEKYSKGGLLKRKLKLAGHKMAGSPISVTSNTLAIDFADLTTLFEEYFEKYGRT